MPRVALRRIFLLRLLDRHRPPSAFVAPSRPFCNAVVTDLVLHLRAACRHYLGYLASILGALCWRDHFRHRVLGPARPPAYWVAAPRGVLGLWGPWHPGVDAPLGQHTLVSMAAEVYGAADDGTALIDELLGALSLPVMHLSHLLWRVTAADHAVSTRSLARPGVLT